MVGTQSTVGKQAKRMPDITVETTWVGEWWVRGWRNDSGGTKCDCKDCFIVKHFL